MSYCSWAREMSTWNRSTASSPRLHKCAPESSGTPCRDRGDAPAGRSQNPCRGRWILDSRSARLSRKRGNAARPRRRYRSESPRAERNRHAAQYPGTDRRTLSAHRRSVQIGHRRQVPALLAPRPAGLADAPRHRAGAVVRQDPAVDPRRRHDAADDGLPVHGFRSQFYELATRCLNKRTPPSNPDYRFDSPTTPTPLPARAFELLGVSFAV